MREILFRGKRKDNNKWVEGFLTIDPTICDYVIDTVGSLSTLIYPETVGQYTGLTDKNGEKIFEGDIFKPYEDEIIYVAWIECFSTLGLMVHTTIEKKKYGKVVSKFVQEGFNFLCDYKLDELKVIGNIHDNPELLKEGADK